MSIVLCDIMQIIQKGCNIVQTLGERIKKARKDKKENQDAFSKKIGVSTRSLAYYEKDEKEPVASTLKNIADSTETSVGWLINGEKENSGAGSVTQSDNNNNIIINTKMIYRGTK